MFELRQRQVVRQVRIASTFSQVAQIVALGEAGFASINHSLQLLADESVSMDRICLSGVHLSNLDLSGTELFAANFSNSTLLNVDLKGAALTSADFSN